MMKSDYQEGFDMENIGDALRIKKRDALSEQNVYKVNKSEPTTLANEELNMNM